MKISVLFVTDQRNHLSLLVAHLFWTRCGVTSLELCAKQPVTQKHYIEYHGKNIQLFDT